MSQPGPWQGDPQQVGYPQTGQQQYGQPQYGQYWQPENGYYSRRKSPLPWLLSIGGIVAIGVIVTLVVVLNSGSDTSTPRGTAEAVVDAFNDGDYDELVDLSCASYRSRMQGIADEVGMYATGRDRFAASAVLNGVDTEGADRAVARITLTVTSVPAELADDLDVGDTENADVELTQTNGAWCISEFG